MPIVVDLSHNNGGKAVSMHELQDGGVVGVILKATQGCGFADPAFDDYLFRARQVGLEVGAYHFLDGSPGQIQFDWHQHILSGAGLLVPALDYETNVASEPTSAGAKVFVDAMVAAHGRHPLLYGSDRLPEVDNLGCLYWRARYGGNEPDGDYALWQYTDQGVIGSMSGLDCSRFHPSITEPAAWWASRSVTF